MESSLRTSGCRLGSLAIAIAATACASVQEGGFPRNFEVFAESGELDEVTLEPDGGGELDLGAERRRIGARFAFGGEAARGYFELFKEEWEFVLPGGLPGAEYDNYGVGGGLRGAPQVGAPSEGIALLVPYRLGMAFVGGQKTKLAPGEPETDMGYVDLHLDVGLGIDWNGLRPSVGVAASAVRGVFTNPAGDVDLRGSNAGLFVDASYKHPDLPLYGYLRFTGGDYEMTTLGFGVQF